MSKVSEVSKRVSQMVEEIISGLQKSQKTLPSKYFYDKRGSELFEQICELDEYYLTRTELKIMKDNIHEIRNTLGESIQLIELGSGSSLKTRLLLNNLKNVHSYVPVDISEEFLGEVAAELQREYPALNIKPVAADYTKPFKLPEKLANVRRIAYYPGSTIGNFTKENAEDFIKLISKLVGNKGGLLIGFDLLKDRDTLLAAYNDSKGITAAFNKNILQRINRELDGDFNLNQFAHKAIFNEEKSRIEMHLVSLKEQKINISGTTIHFDEEETIHTENSHKYSIESFKKLTKPFLKPTKTWIDKEEKFCVQFLS